MGKELAGGPQGADSWLGEFAVHGEAWAGDGRGVERQDWRGSNVALRVSWVLGFE